MKQFNLIYINIFSIILRLLFSKFNYKRVF